MTRGRKTPTENYRSSGFRGFCAGLATLPCKKISATETQTRFNQNFSMLEEKVLRMKDEERHVRAGENRWKLQDRKKPSDLETSS